MDNDHKILPIGSDYEIPGAGTITLYDGKVRIIDSEVFNHELSQFKKRKKQIEDLADAFLDGGDSMAIKYLGFYYNWLPADKPGTEAEQQQLRKYIVVDGYTAEQADNIIRNDIYPYDARPSSITAEVQTSERFIKKLNKLLWIIRYVGIVFTGEQVVPQPNANTQNEEKLLNANSFAGDRAKLEVARNRGLLADQANLALN